MQKNVSNLYSLIGKRLKNGAIMIIIQSDPFISVFDQLRRPNSCELIR